MLFGIIPVALGVLILICTACNHSRQRRAAQAAQAAQEAAAAEKKRHAERARQEKEAQAEREKAARQAAAEQKKQEAERKRQEREQRQAAAHAVKLARAAELAELAERRLQAEKELAQLRQQAAQQPAERPAMSLDEFAASIAPQPFKGQTVSFTGTLYNAAGEHVSREKAIALVKSLGGKAFKEMPAGTTLLVVGENPGMQKMDRADEWIGQVKKITPAQFWQMAGAAA